MADTLALEKLFDDVVLAFGRAAAVVTRTGTATWTLTASPVEAHTVEIEITTGGTVGVAGVLYKHRTDGAAWVEGVALGVATSATVSGAVVAFGAGTLLVGDKVVLTLATNHTFGWREPARVKPRPNRIVWAPGDASGSLGEIRPPRYPGRTPARPVGTLVDAVTVTLTAYDASAPENERAQWKAVRLLFDEWFRCVYVSAYGTFQIQRAEFIRTTTERQRGAAIRAVCVIESMIPDEEALTAPVDTDASVDHKVFTVHEIEVIEAPAP